MKTDVPVYTNPSHVTDRLLVWGLDNIEPEAVDQAARCSRLNIIDPYVALMPDAHFGLGSTVGSVIPTVRAVIPAAVGVDIGCGMAAIRTNLTAGDLPDSLEPLLDSIASQVPSGVGKQHSRRSRSRDGARQWLAANPVPAGGEIPAFGTDKIIAQFGTLGSGNHFIEVCLGEELDWPPGERQTDQVWIVLHSGSRGVGNKTAQRHVRAAQEYCALHHIELEDRDLAYLSEGTSEFDRYIGDLLWCQAYALGNRQAMLNSVFAALKHHVPKTRWEQVINCHHNYTELEHHHNRNVWLTRKGAIRARNRDMGIIPGSMGAATYIVRGLGNPASFCSCSHGAGRTMSRTKAKQSEATADWSAMEGKAWLGGKAEQLRDEHPAAYKDIGAVMEAQRELVEPVSVLRQILNYKGAK